jgi:hypothetical protein
MRPAETPTAAYGAATRPTCGARMLPDGDVCVRIRMPMPIPGEEEDGEDVFGHMGAQTLPPSRQRPDSDR